ncbi:MAG: glycoside hydrolase family 15 protein [Rhizobiales bacterium]|nr:glycoside hydrolase family 15 protein [Hyphomicrobiales bacterium]
MPSKIEDYALIGDCESAALVSRNGSIDWLCWPRFDSEACFAALLGAESHGHWIITPVDENARITRRYCKNTLILETRFETDEGAVTLIDFMPLRDQRTDLARIIVGERGEVRMRTELVVRFGYGATVPWVSRLPDRTLRMIAGPDMLLFHAPLEMRGKDMRTVGEFTVKAGDKIPIVMTYAPSHLEPPTAVDAWKALAVTEKFWTDWVAKSSVSGPHEDAVIRSLITLKALTFAPTGGIVAAPTTSLPEMLGGERNWDYRFCWLRDATLTLLALMNSGYYDEARAWRDWLLRAVAGSPHQMQIMYGIAGERRLTEWEVPWLPGYENAKPVRVGNAAHSQVQLDVYGEMMDALHQARRGHLDGVKAGWDVQLAILAHLETIWRKPDEGIWEVRGEREHFTYSKVMAWVAFDRMIKGAEEFKLPGPVEHWKAVRKTIHDDVCAKGFDRDLGSFVRAYGSKQLDASLLLIGAVGFLPHDDPRIVGTVQAVEKALLVDGFLQRYDTVHADDGLPAGEGAFLACSFWLVDAYMMCGQRDKAEKLFERLLSLRNDLGLLSEEYDPRSRRLIGNFPQAFSHIALIDSAANLTRSEKPAEQRAGEHAHALA